MPTNKDAILQELLILRCKRGDEQAFTELIHLWEKRLFFYIRRLVATEEDAWDVLQQTWLKVFQGIKSLKHSGSFPTWLYKVARHVAISQWWVITASSRTLPKRHYKWKLFMRTNIKPSMMPSKWLPHWVVYPLNIAKRRRFSFWMTCRSMRLPKFWVFLKAPSSRA